MTGTTTEIITGDCIVEMQEMDENSVHAVVTDPPYNFEGGFMGQAWDNIGSPTEYQDWCEAWATEALRLLKPGGHLVAFSSTKAYHRLASGVEDAGFTVRDQLDWLHGQGMPKGSEPAQWMDGDDVDRWAGFKSELNPAHEPIVLARKPLSESSLYKNVLRNETGALNIEGCRVGPGRYPSNVCLDPRSAALLDKQTGELGNQYRPNSNKKVDRASRVYGENKGRFGDPTHGYDDSGGASRFFYTAKAAKNERTINGQVDDSHPTVKPLDLMEWLVTLVTALGQRVLDPFAGSGTAIMACKRLGREGVGIEMDEGYADIARKRVELAHEVETDFGNTPSERTHNNGQPGLDAFADGNGE